MMRHAQPSLFDQQVYKAGQRVTVTITGVVTAVRSAGHDHVILSIGAPTSRPDYHGNITYVMAGDPAVTITPEEQA